MTVVVDLVVNVVVEGGGGGGGVRGWQCTMQRGRMTPPQFPFWVGYGLGTGLARVHKSPPAPDPHRTQTRALGLE